MATRTLFVTCGATVPFPELVELVLSQGCLERLKNYGFVRVIVQFGRGYKEEFKRGVNTIHGIPQSCSLDDRELGCCSGESLSMSVLGALEIIGIEYSTRVHDIVQIADLVISHAGTGSILDSLRLKKPLIVCVNDRLMDNHQQQIADKFQQKNYVWACKPQPCEFYDCLRKSQSEQLNSFPQAHNVQFENQLIKLAFTSSNVNTL